MAGGAVFRTVARVAHGIASPMRRASTPSRRRFDVSTVRRIRPTPPTVLPPSPRLFLVDGYALIYRAFFALISRPLTTSRGENTSAAWGIVNFLQRSSQTHKPDYLGWVHDSGLSFRHERYPGVQGDAREAHRGAAVGLRSRHGAHSRRSSTRITFQFSHCRAMKPTTSSARSREQGVERGRQRRRRLGRQGLSAARAARASGCSTPDAAGRRASKSSG